MRWGLVLLPFVGALSETTYGHEEMSLQRRRLNDPALDGHQSVGAPGDAYTLISRAQTECEVEALTTGTRLADVYNSLDEQTEWDVRIHNDYLTEHMGFAGWIQQGTWGSKGVTPLKQSAAALYKRGGWAGARDPKDLQASHSSYWPLENQWLYMMGDSTQRQIWGSINSPLEGHDFERNAKEWTRENCAKQYPRRKKHPEGNHPDEGWSGKCGNNEVTCHMSGFGARGKVTFDWKHFPYEDYDEWIFGPQGLWGSGASTNNGTDRRPDILNIQVGLHTCFHAFNPGTGAVNHTFVQWHTRDLPRLMRAVRTAVDLPRTPHADAGLNRTLVIFSTSGRIGNPSPDLDRCSWTFNRALALEAHRHGFAVFEREEIERRLLFKSEHNAVQSYIKTGLHLASPSPQIIATSLAAMIGCLRRSGY